MAADDPDKPNQVYYVMRRFRGSSSIPYRTERSAARPFRPSRAPGPSKQCHVCNGTDHFARTCSQLHRGETMAPAAARFTTTAPTTDSPKLLDVPDYLTPPEIPSQTTTDAAPDTVFFTPTARTSTSYATSHVHIATAIIDTGTPGDLVGGTWLKANPQVQTTAVIPSRRRYALGNDIPTPVGQVIYLTRSTRRPCTGACSWFCSA